MAEVAEEHGGWMAEVAEVAEVAEEHGGYVGELVTYPPSLKKSEQCR